MERPFAGIEKNGYVVLVIEDNPGDRRLAEITLKEGAAEAGVRCEALVADGLKQATQLLAENDDVLPDAILLDLGLPDAAGFEALTTLNSICPETPIIILTGQNDSATAGQAIRYGAADYLEKEELRPRSLWRAINYSLVRKTFEAELVGLAVTDPLTGLKNRRALFDILEQAVDQARRSELCCGVLVIDIDNFKQVNDLLGHDAGDEFLKVIARKMTEVLRRTDTVGRLGGDEFAVIAPNLKSPSGAFEIAEKLSAAIRSITDIRGSVVASSASIGVAVFPSDDVGHDGILAHADMAMYKAKRSGVSPICFYDDNMHREIRYRHQMKKMMLSDLSADSFYLDYQPIVDARTHRIAGAEGLARWRDPQNKIIMPTEFIPVAEENGWISTLGIQLIEQACAFLRRCQEAGEPVVPLSINVSPIQCSDAGFPLHVTSTILKYGLNPALINIEITESTVMRNIDTVRRSFEVLREAGIGIHIDDFGTGYSSLSLLKDLPFNHLKIDRSFIASMMDDTGTMRIMEAIASLASRLHFKTVGEGVETEEQARVLVDIGIDYLQGYYFSRPISPEDLQSKLACNKAGAMAGVEILARHKHKA